MKDIVLKEFDLQTDSNSDFELSESQNQSVEMLLISEQGEWKH